MSNIRKIIFDSQSFPFTPYTRHVAEISDGLRMIFIDHSAEPQKKKFVLDLEDLFENPAQKRALGKVDQPNRRLRMSRLKVMKQNFKAQNYLIAFLFCAMKYIILSCV